MMLAVHDATLIGGDDPDALDLERSPGGDGEARQDVSKSTLVGPYAVGYLTRHLAEHIMTQVESPANLDRWTSPEGRLITLILIHCGLRATDACTLAFDCLIHDGQGAPYLRYVNHKMRREAAVPVDEELEAAIRGQQQRVADRWPGRHPSRRTVDEDRETGVGVEEDSRRRLAGARTTGRGGGAGFRG